MNQENTFSILKTSLTLTPILGCFSPCLSTEIHTDAINCGIGALLGQKQDGVEQVVSYASHIQRSATILPPKENAWLSSVYKFRPYVFDKLFFVVTNCHSLCWLLSVKDPYSGLARWSLKLQAYDIS